MVGMAMRFRSGRCRVSSAILPVNLLRPDLYARARGGLHQAFSLASRS
jgi:hypothetical protein